MLINFYEWVKYPATTNCACRHCVSKDLVQNQIDAKYPHKGWKLDTVKRICRRIDWNGSAVQQSACAWQWTIGHSPHGGEHRRSSGTDPFAEDETATRSSTALARLPLSWTSVCRIAKNWSSSAQVFPSCPGAGYQRLDQTETVGACHGARALLRRITTRRTKQVFFTDKKTFI